MRPLRSLIIFPRVFNRRDVVFSIWYSCNACFKARAIFSDSCDEVMFLATGNVGISKKECFRNDVS